MAQQINLNKLMAIMGSIKSGKVEVHFEDGIITSFSVKRARKEPIKQRFYK